MTTKAEMNVISSDQIMFWLEANNAKDVSSLMMLLEQIANGDYTPQELNANISEFMLTGELS